MRRLAVFVALLVLVPSASSASAPAPYAGRCGLPATQPLWFEFGQPYLEPIFGQRGVVVGASTGDWPAKMRALGAGTVYFDLNLRGRVGTPTKPADPATMPDRAKRLYEFAVQQTACANPVIAFNELSGPNLVTPWSDTNAQYRANVLSLVEGVAVLGARPVLLIPKAAYAGDEALQWWRAVAKSAELVREIYVPASATWKQGPVLGSRNLRNAYRNAVTNLIDMGIPANKVGIMLSFATTVGFGGRNGLQPVGAWYQVIKWQALAARQIAAETGIASIWSWGWGRWSAGEQDPAKGRAACVWLWTRSPSLCDAPKQLGRGFDTSLSEGQLSLLAGATQCLVGTRRLTAGEITQLQRVTGDRETAYSTAYERIVESAYSPVPTKAALDAERAVIRQSFGGSRAAYVKALRAAGANVSIARGVLGDELRRARVESTLPVGPVSDAEVQTFYRSYPDLQVRLVEAKPRPSWLPLARGLALSEVAPDAVFALRRGKASVVRTSEGSFRVKPVGDALPLGAVPLAKATPTIAAALRRFARGDTFEQWTVGKQRYVLNNALCKRDDLPQPSAVDLTQFLPFLRLG